MQRGNGDLDLEVANCKFPEFGKHFDINVLRKANNKASPLQTVMTLNGRFTATVPVQDTTGATIRVQRPFVWKHTSNLMLIDEETGQTAAVFHGLAYGLKKCCVLEIQQSYGYGWELLIVTSAMTIYEKQRREYSSPSGTRLAPTRGARAAAAAQAGFSASAAGSIGGAMGGGGF